MRLRHALAPLALAAVGVLLIAACGGSDSPEVANLGDAATTETEQTDTTVTPEDQEEALLAYAECMRGEGIDFPDPQFSGDGEGGLFIGPDSGIDPNDPDFQAADETCRSHLEAIRPEFDPEQAQELQDAALAFAQCMRDQGYDVPDPEFEEGGGMRQLFGENLDPNDPDVQAAMEKCQESSFGDLGPGPGPPGEESGGES
jgi:hypothetical protein